MKKILFLVIAALFVSQLWSQNVNSSREDRNFRIPLIGEKAPSFVAESTNGTLSFPGDLGRKWKVLFSHPADFTPVCTTEIMQLATMQDQLDKLGIKIVIVSTDALETHKQWKKSMEGLTLDNGESIKIHFPLVDDDNKAISKLYGMIHPESNTTKSVRGVYVIDPDNIVQAIYFYPTSVGRNTDELIRTVAALQTTSNGSVFTPVNWKTGNDLLVPIPPKTDITGKTSVPEGYYSPVWYLWFKKGPQSDGNFFPSAN